MVKKIMWKIIQFKIKRQLVDFRVIDDIQPNFSVSAIRQSAE